MSMPPSPPPAPPRLNALAVARDAWDLLIGSRGVLLVAIAVAAILFVGALVIGVISALAAAPFLDGGSDVDAFGPAYVLIIVFLVAIGLLATGGFAAQIEATARADRGLPVEVRPILANAARQTFRLLPLVILLAVIVGLGLMALIVPGFMAMAYFFVAVPVALFEGLGPIDALKRSAALTEGQRWNLFGAWFGIGLVVSILANMVEALLQLLGFPLTFALLQFSFFVLWNAWNANYVAITYLRLRELKG